MSADTREDLVELPNGKHVLLRPIRPEDAPLLENTVHHMAPEDLRLRFFAPLRELSPKLLHRLTHPDPTREAAIVVHPEEAPDILAVGRLGLETGSRSAEFAIAVRTDMKGHGLGYMLMGRLIDVARQRGYAEIFGLVLHENARMLQICREYGFALMDDLEDPGVVRAVKRLD